MIVYGLNCARQLQQLVLAGRGIVPLLAMVAPLVIIPAEFIILVYAAVQRQHVVAVLVVTRGLIIVLRVQSISFMKKNNKHLIRRYLLWCYKMTKEELERIDRKFTQLAVDSFVLREFEKNLKSLKGRSREDFAKKINEFKDYMATKEQNANGEKFQDLSTKQLKPHYFYLTQRLSAIEKSIVSFLGRSELKKIQELYDQEMIHRILESREHT